MKQKIKPIIGHIYYLKAHTAPYCLLGDGLHCLLTDEKRWGDELIIEDLGHIKDWKKYVYLPERFMVGLSPRTYTF